MVTRVPIVLGGTGADNAADARANLGVLSSTGNVVVSNIVVGSGNVLHSVSGANVLLTLQVLQWLVLNLRLPEFMTYLLNELLH